MNTFVLLLRGINVGGRNKLPMKELVGVLENAGFKNVRTYIQSGNIVFEANNKVLEGNKNHSATLEGQLEAKFGFKPRVLVLTKSAFLTVVQKNPFTCAEGTQIHFYFCDKQPKLDKEKVDRFISNTERYELVDKVLYLFAPDGIGRSKLVSNIESCLGVDATGRNLNTVDKLTQMLES